MGGGHDAPAQPSPMEQAQAQIAIDKAEAARAQQAAAREDMKKAREEKAKTLATQEGVNQAYSQGQNYGTNRASNLGFADTYGLLNTYTNLLNTAKAGVPKIADNVSSYFDYNNLWDQATNQVTGAQRNLLDTAYRNNTKQGWEQGYWGDTADDDILNAIMGEQYGEAFDTIDAARARGQISQGAFDNTLRKLNNAKTGAMSTLQDLGGTVLGGYRKNLDDIASNYNDQITNYKLGQNLSIDDMLAAFGQSKEGNMGRLKGDVYRALGDTSLFNTDSLISKGNAAAGVSNNPLRNAFRDTSATDPERTTGTSGVF